MATMNEDTTSDMAVALCLEEMSDVSEAASLHEMVDVTTTSTETTATASASSSEHEDAASSVDCFVCGEDDCDETWSCPDGHTTCRDCLRSYLLVKMETHEVAPLACPGFRCDKIVDLATMQDLLRDDEAETARLRRIVALKENGNMRACPGCGNLQEGDPMNPAMACTGCGLEYCFHHETAHAPGQCSRMSKFSLRSEVYKFIHTKRCPKCRIPVRKNGGCQHMTCVCGYEFCWYCMCDWAKVGYEHRQLFPRPSRLRYTCNSPQAWAMRTGIVVAAVPAAALAIPVAGCFMAFRALRDHIRQSRLRRAMRAQRRAQRAQQRKWKTSGGVIVHMHREGMEDVDAVDVAAEEKAKMHLEEELVIRAAAMAELSLV